MVNKKLKLLLAISKPLQHKYKQMMTEATEFLGSELDQT
jgi:hypothetical protein